MTRLTRNWDLVLPYALMVLWYVMMDLDLVAWAICILATIALAIALHRSRTGGYGQRRLLWLAPVALVVGFLMFAYPVAFLMEAAFGPGWADI